MNSKYYIDNSNIHGKGAFASRNYAIGDNIGKLHKILKLGEEYRWTELGRMYNHSDEPNTKNVLEGDTRYMVALRPIRMGEELTSNYRLQPDMEQPEQWTGSEESESDFGDLPKAQFGGIVKGIKNIIKKVPKFTKRSPIIKKDINLNAFKEGMNPGFTPKQLPFKQTTFFRGHKNPNINLKDITSHPTGRTNYQFENISPITNKPNLNIPKPDNATWWTPDENIARGLHDYTSKANLNIKNPFYMRTRTGNREWSFDEIQKLMDDGFDAIIMNAKKNNPDNWWNASEIIPLDKNVIQKIEKIKRMGGSINDELIRFRKRGEYIDGKFVPYEYDEKGYRIQKFGQNKDKWTATDDWTDYETYEHNDKNYQRRTFNLNRKDLEYIKYNKSHLKDVDTQVNQSFRSLVDNTKRDMRVQETVTPSGRKIYKLQYKTDHGWTTYASGDENSGLANLTPEYIDTRKSKGLGPISQYSSWFGMTPAERKEYNLEDWINTPFQMDLRIDKDGNTWGGWNVYGDKSQSALTYTLRDKELHMLPKSIIKKYNLVGKDHLRMDPYNGEIYLVNDRGSIRSTISQKDMQWFQNPGRLEEAFSDPRFNFKEDKILDYLNNYDFQYWQDTQPINIEKKELTKIKRDRKNPTLLPPIVPVTPSNNEQNTSPINPEEEIKPDMSDIVLTPNKSSTPNKTKNVPKPEFKNVRGSTQYVNKSAEAILNAIKGENYTEKDLNRDLDIFKKYYGEDNFALLKEQLPSTPKAKAGIELKKYQDAGEKDPGWLAQRLRESITPIGYNIPQATKELLAGEKLPFEWEGKPQTWETFGQNVGMSPNESKYIKSISQDLWDQYLGFQPENNTIKQSNFIPSKNTGKGDYYSFNFDSDIWNDVIKYFGDSLLKEFDPKGVDDNGDPLNEHYIKDSNAGGYNLRNYKLTRGFDEERGLPYVSYWDEFDFDIPIAGFDIPGETVVGEPFELYGRMYYDPNPDANGNIVRINEEDLDDYNIDRESLKAGIIHVESNNGKYLSNSESTASGLYGQLFSELEGNENYEGTRDEFINDPKSQDNIFNQRYEGTLFKNQKGLKESGEDLYLEFVNEIEDFPYNKTEVAALVNFLGRQGARDFLKGVLVDNKTLEEVFPSLYGEDAEQKNKTPNEYIEEFREGVKQYRNHSSFEDYVLKVLPQDISEHLLVDYDEEEIENKEFSKGGELKGKFTRKWDRLSEQLKKYEDGGKVSPIVKDELILYDLIDMPKSKFSTGGPVTDGSDWRGVPQSQMTDVQYERMLQDMKEKNMGPSYWKNKSNKKEEEESVVLDNESDDSSEVNIVNEEKPEKKIEVKPKVKPKPKPKVNTKIENNININDKNKYDNLPFGQAFNKARSELGPNRIFYWKGSKYQTNKSDEPWNPSESELDRHNMNTIKEHENIVLENELVNSPHSNKTHVDLETATGTWKNVEKVKLNNDDINKLKNIEKINYYHNQDFSDDDLYETIEYQVQSGDMIDHIAKNNFISIHKLKQDNNLRNDNIQVGQTLIIKKPKLKPYVVIDKKAGKTYVYYPGDSQPYDSYNTLLGKNIGDEQTVTKAIDQNGDGIIDDRDKVDGKYVFDPQAGNRKTGAGIFTITTVNPNSGYWDETGQNRNTPSFNLTNDNQPDGQEIATTIHGIRTDSTEGQRRKDALYSETVDDNRTTYGCANMGCSDLIDMANVVEPGTKVYILPDNDKNYFHYQDGQVVFKANEDAPRNDEGQFINPNTGEVSNVGWYQDERGDWQEGQGINRTKNTINYNPIRITIDKNKIQNTLFNGQPLDYNSTVEQENKEFNNTTMPYLNALVENKSDILKALQKVNSGIPSDVYDRLIKLSFGVYGVESGMGNENTEVMNIALSAGKTLGLTDTNPDVQRKYDGYGIWGIDSIGKMKLNAQNPDDSVGWTQIRWDGGLDDDEKKLLKYLGITSQHDLMDPTKAAIATQAIFSMRYNTRLSHLSEDEKNSDMIYHELATTWNKGANYSKRVSNYFPFIDVYTANIDDIVENNIKEQVPFSNAIEGEPQNIYLDVMGNQVSPDDPNVFMVQNLTDGSVKRFENPSVIIQGEYEEKGASTEDQIANQLPPQYGLVGTGPRMVNWVLDKFGYVSGGEMDGSTQKQIYTDYINGKFDNTNQEKSVKKLIDKMNRVYYNTVKSVGGHVYDYIRKL